MYTHLCPNSRYWDWNIDWEDIPGSEIWDPETGFGGDGGTDTSETVGFGSCVKNGPFAVNYTVHYFNNTIRPHCLSRGFGRRNTPAHFESEPFSPATMQRVFQQDTFMNFTTVLENGPHNAIPNNICGDFYAAEAPNGKWAASTVQVGLMHMVIVLLTYDIRSCILYPPCTNGPPVVEMANADA